MTRREFFRAGVLVPPAMRVTVQATGGFLAWVRSQWQTWRLRQEAIRGWSAALWAEVNRAPLDADLRRRLNATRLIGKLSERRRMIS